MLMELDGPIPFIFLCEGPINSEGNMLLEFPGPDPSGFLIEALFKIHGKCSLNSLGQFHHISSLVLE